MAESILPAQSKPNDRAVGFAAVGPFYTLHPDVTPFDVRDQLNARLAQLNAMLEMTHGNGRESFDSWSDEVRDNYLWSCSMLAKECEELTNHLG